MTLMKRALARWVVVAVVAAAPASAAARDRLAVLMDAQNDAALADNLTEVAISVLAERRDRELVGMQELRGRLAPTFAGAGGIEACLSQAACLAEVGAVAEASHAVIGTIRPAGDQVTLALSLTDVRTAVVEARSSKTLAPDVPGLVAALREGLGALFDARPVSPPALAIAVAPAIGGPTAHLDLVQQHDVKRPASRGARAAGYVSIGAAALAVVAFSGAVIRGSMANDTPVAGTRAIMQDDLERRAAYAHSANMLYVAGGVLSAVSAAALYWWLRDPTEGRAR